MSKRLRDVRDGLSGFSGMSDAAEIRSGVAEILSDVTEGGDTGGMDNL